MRHGPGGWRLADVGPTWGPPVIAAIQRRPVIARCGVRTHGPCRLWVIVVARHCRHVRRLGLPGRLRGRARRGQGTHRLAARVTRWRARFQADFGALGHARFHHAGRRHTLAAYRDTELFGDHL